MGSVISISRVCYGHFSNMNHVLLQDNMVGGADVILFKVEW